eukprot:gb/GFBE01057832.1/.p1 GENE.gb/GFBE01057832.1/~~gb/GFBE01057832.1/.p1  ORF type:complete len:378 (+),score=66.28 gb/GFBE01057832.1/:1-1134(+)
MAPVLALENRFPGLILKNTFLEFTTVHAEVVTVHRRCKSEGCEPAPVAEDYRQSTSSQTRDEVPTPSSAASGHSDILDGSKLSKQGAHLKVLSAVPCTTGFVAGGESLRVYYYQGESDSGSNSDDGCRIFDELSNAMSSGSHPTADGDYWSCRSAPDEAAAMLQLSEHEMRALKLAHRKLFVGNLSRHATHDDLWETFCKYGPLEHACVMGKDTPVGSRGFGFVTFRHRESAARAMADEPQLFYGQPVDVKLAVPQKLLKRFPQLAGSPKYVNRDVASCSRQQHHSGDRTLQKQVKLFVGSLPRHATGEDLRHLFAHHGEVIDPVVMCDHYRVSRGFGFFFVVGDAAFEVLKGGPYYLHGRQLDVKLAVPRGTERSW